MDFSFPWRSRSYESVNASCPVVFDNKVFISASYRTGGALLEIRPDFTHNVLWTTQEFGLHFNTPIYRDGYLYGFDGRNEPDASLACVDVSTGKVVWREIREWNETLGGRQQPVSIYRGSLLAVDGSFSVPRRAGTPAVAGSDAEGLQGDLPSMALSRRASRGACRCSVADCSTSCRTRARSLESTDRDCSVTTFAPEVVDNARMTGARLAIVMVVALSASLHAQWLNYPTRGVPRTLDGKPDLSAPAPRAADGKPDLSGIWQLEPRPCDASECQTDYVPAAEFINFGAKLPGGLPYQPWAATLVKERTEQLGKDDPVGLCRPGGALRILTFPPFRKFLQMPGLFVILSERDVTYRQIFMDGRPLPDDPTPTFNGYSVGRWDGDTLVVTSNGFREGTWLDRNGSPMSDAAKLTERYRRVNYGRLEIDVTLDDPKVYTRPWTVTLTQLIVLDTELLDYHCMDNERDAARLVGK